MRHVPHFLAANLVIEIDICVLFQALDIPELSPQIQRKCIRLLRKMCGRHALLPRTLKIPISYDQTSTALYRGRYADVWKGEHNGRDVAVKVIRTYSDNDLQKIVGVSYWSCSLSACLALTWPGRGSARRL